jgi:hypothetical protein
MQRPFALAEQNGHMSATMTDHTGAYVVFGSCTAL